MNLQQFLDHWAIVENPFRGEEARQDPVFLRLEAASQAGRGGVAPAADISGQNLPGATAHSDFEKIAGDFARPSSSIVFGEKGSGKTAIRLQLADRVSAYNAAHPQAKALWIGYDDLNPILGRYMERSPRDKKSSTTDILGRLRLVDHIDGILTIVVPALVATLLKERATDPGTPGLTSAGTGAAGGVGLAGASALTPGEEPKKFVKKLDAGTRRDLLVLQAIYDRPETATGAEDRTRRLRRLLRIPAPISGLVWTVLAYVGWAVPGYLAFWAFTHDQLQPDPSNRVLYLIAGALAVYLVILFKRSIYDRLRYITLGHRVRKQVRVSLRSDASYGRSLRQLPEALVDPGVLPMGGSDDVRYAMLERLRRVIAPMGFSSIVVVADRVDEPTLVAGDPDRMRAVVWPLMNNKLLQQPGIAFKMLLPMELRHALFRESAQFFQEARLDKQNMIERLSWTGSMLYDLSSARLNACRAPGSAVIGLIDLFAEDVTRQDVIDALDQMHQPRDAFKLLYQCLVEHCASVTSDQAAWRIPRLVLENVKKAQVERVRQLYRGVRPA